jgi:hypothetical protein
MHELLFDQSTFYGHQLSALREESGPDLIDRQLGVFFDLQIDAWGCVYEAEASEIDTRNVWGAVTLSLYCLAVSWGL